MRCSKTTVPYEERERGGWVPWHRNSTMPLAELHAGVWVPEIRHTHTQPDAQAQAQARGRVSRGARARVSDAVGSSQVEEWKDDEPLF